MVPHPTMSVHAPLRLTSGEFGARTLPSDPRKIVIEGFRVLNLVQEFHYRLDVRLSLLRDSVLFGLRCQVEVTDLPYYGWDSGRIRWGPGSPFSDSDSSSAILYLDALRE